MPAPPVVVTLDDDDSEQPLFDEKRLGPGATSVRCITVTYRGDEDAVDVELRVRATGPLTEWLTVSISAGTVTGRDCAGFVPARSLGKGTLRALSGRPDDAVRSTRARNGVPFGVRIVTELPRDVPPAAAGASAQGSFLWTVD